LLESQAPKDLQPLISAMKKKSQRSNLLFFNTIYHFYAVGAEDCGILLDINLPSDLNRPPPISFELKEL